MDAHLPLRGNWEMTAVATRRRLGSWEKKVEDFLRPVECPGKKVEDFLHLVEYPGPKEWNDHQARKAISPQILGLDQYPGYEFPGAGAPFRQEDLLDP